MNEQQSEFQPLSQNDDLENQTEIDSILSDNTQPLSDDNSDDYDNSNSHNSNNKIQNKNEIELTQNNQNENNNENENNIEEEEENLIKHSNLSKSLTQKISNIPLNTSKPSSSSSSSNYKLLPNFPLHEA